MRNAVVAGLGLVAALTLPAAASQPVPETGPYAGQVTQGQTHTHRYDNNPSNNPCLALAANYTITLHGVPSGDVLSLSVLDESVTTSNGVAAVTITQGVCARFSIGVTGTSVADTATYAVTVTRQFLPPIS